jgi:hypothetical protein
VKCCRQKDRRYSLDDQQLSLFYIYSVIKNSPAELDQPLSSTHPNNKSSNLQSNSLIVPLLSESNEPPQYIWCDQDAPFEQVIEVI